MFYAVDLGALDATLVGSISQAAVVHYLDAHAQFLPNAAHSPASLDSLLELDSVLEASGYPPEFRYSKLLNAPWLLRLEHGDEPVFGGSVTAEVVTRVAALARSAGVPQVTDAWQRQAIEELLDNTKTASDRGLGLVGIYS